MSLATNKDVIRRVFEEVIPAGIPAAMRDYVADDFLDHHPLPGQPAGVEGAEYVVATMHGAHPDLRFAIDDLVAEDDRVDHPLDDARHPQRAHARAAADERAGGGVGDRHLPPRGRQDRRALGGLDEAARLASGRSRPDRPHRDRRAGRAARSWRYAGTPTQVKSSAASGSPSSAGISRVEERHAEAPIAEREGREVQPARRRGRRRAGPRGSRGRRACRGRRRR